VTLSADHFLKDMYGSTGAMQHHLGYQQQQMQPSYQQHQQVVGG
jgi:hypothetical protein